MLIDENMNNVPSDWKDPDFDIGSGKHVHEWKSYVDSEVQELWDDFSDEVKQALSQNYNGIADNEEWD